MSKVQVPVSMIEEFLNEEKAVRVTSFSWGENSIHGEPDIEWELDYRDDFFTYEDDDYVEADEFNELEQKYKDVCRDQESLKEQLEELKTQLVEKDNRIKEQAQTIIKYTSAAKPKPKRTFLSFFNK